MDNNKMPAPSEVTANLPLFLRVVTNFHDWLHVISSPRHLKSMQRVPTREHLLRMLDIYMFYARSSNQWFLLERDKTVPTAKHWSPDPLEREARALDLHAAIERWTTPEISREITLAARALLHANGRDEPKEGWDDFAVEVERPPDDDLLWPENLLEAY